MAYAIWIVIFFLISFGLGSLYREAGRSQWFRLIFLPGFLAVSLVKALACGVTGTKIKEFAPFGNNTDPVGYDIKKSGWVRITIVNLVTFLGALALLFLIAWACNTRIGYKVKPPTAPASAEHAIRATSHEMLNMFFDTTKRVWHSIGKSLFAEGDIAVLIYLYLVISLLLAMPTPIDEFKYGLFGAIGLGLVILGLSLVIELKNPRIGRNAWGILSFASAMTLYLLGATLISAGGKHLYVLLRKKPPSRPEEN